MGSFTTTYSVTYQNGSLTGAPIQGPFSATLTDGDADTTFETGDTVTAFTLGYTYAGTATVNGKEWPAFTWDDDPTYVIVYLDELPVAPPATFTANSSTFNGACFGAGTLIATPNGERRVEDLGIGDLVSTTDGRATRALWIGVASKPTAIAGDRWAAVRIRKNALGAGLPHSDLVVTADHGMVVDGAVINAGGLVNGDAISFVPLSELPNRVTYYHIETEGHDVILANGAPAETFIDAAGRAAFDNHAEYLDLYGAERLIPEMRMPRIASARLVPQAIKDRLATPGAAAPIQGKVAKTA